MLQQKIATAITPIILKSTDLADRGASEEVTEMERSVKAEVSADVRRAGRTYFKSRIWCGKGEALTE
jgi:transcription termination factor Rho